MQNAGTHATAAACSPAVKVDRLTITMHTTYAVQTNMITSPYNIYPKGRPLRIAFLVNNAARTPDPVQAIIEYNQTKWGGRYNPILLTDGRDFDAASWAFLTEYDPDVIKALLPLSAKLVEEIHQRLSPFALEVPRPRRGRITHIRLETEGISILPTQEAILSMNTAFDGPPPLSVFKLDRSLNRTIQAFVKYNFGLLGGEFATQRALSSVAVRAFQLIRVQDLASALQTLSSFEPKLFPVHLCSSEGPPVVPDNPEPDNAFTVVVGDTRADLALAWNHVFGVPPWQRHMVKQAWLSTRILGEPALFDALRSWLHRATDPYGSTTPHVRFVTCSLSTEELQTLADQLASGVFMPHSVHVLPANTLQVLASEQPHLRIKERVTPHRATGDQIPLVLDEPAVQEGVMGGEHWMADLYIQYRPERYPNIRGRGLWWQFPQKNVLAHSVFRHPSRIMRSRFPSLVMARGANRVEVSLPDDQSLIRIPLVLDDTPYVRGDPRARYGKAPFADTRPSDKGKYLTGLLDAFEDLPFAFQTIESRYWRHMFDLLSQQSPQKNARRVEEVKNKLRKMRTFDPNSEEGLDWMANQVFNIAKGLVQTGAQLSYSTFVLEATKELQAYNARQDANLQIPFDETDVRQSLFGLTSSGIIHIGLTPRCPRCGSVFWYEVAALKQTLQCLGCSSEFALKPEEPWKYRLNSLVHAGYVHHGLAPVVLVLGQLFQHCHTSFMMATSLDVFENYGEQPLTDLDIACVVDGKLIIGEVKQSFGGFKLPQDIDKMADIANRIRPDRLIFSALEQSGPPPALQAHINRIEGELAPLGIEVGWHSLSGVFEPLPVR